jgi:hypothetical protein
MASDLKTYGDLKKLINYIKTFKPTLKINLKIEV